MNHPRHAAIDETVRKAALGRMNRFLSHRAAPLLLPVGWGGDPAKEVTESYAVLDAALRVAVVRGLRRNDYGVSVLVVGDGTSPRTGALFATSTAWKVTSIDPAMKPMGAHATIPRLDCIRARLEDRPDLTADIVVAVHSHAPVAATRAACRPGGFVVSLPCCVAWPSAGAVENYLDGACLSPDRRVLVFHSEEV